jgi:hypothetical protein
VAIPAHEAVANFGWLSAFVGKDMTSLSSKTQMRLGWKPSGPGLITDIRDFFSQ